jgi:hypothetical protein
MKMKTEKQQAKHLQATIDRLRIASLHAEKAMQLGMPGADKAALDKVVASLQGMVDEMVADLGGANVVRLR